MTTTTQRWQWLALGLVVAALLYLLAPVLTPFVTAALFAYLFDPLVDRLERLRLSRDFAVTLVFVVMLLVLVGILLVLVPYIWRQVDSFITQLPRWWAWFQTEAAPWLEAKLGLSLDLPDPAQLLTILQDHWKEAGGFAATAVARVSKSGFAIIGWLVHLILVPVVTFYLLRDWDILVERVRELLPRSVEPTVTKLARDSDEVLSAFLRGQVSVMIVLGVIYAVGLRAVGLEVGPLIGMLAGLISFVPYLGPILGVVMGVIAALVQFHDWLHVILVLVVFTLGHVIESYVLVPKLIGDKIGLHPVAVMFAVLAGGELFGFLGVLLALPVAAVFMVLLRYLHERYTTSALYQSGTPPTAATPGDIGMAPAPLAPSVVVVPAPADPTG